MDVGRFVKDVLETGAVFVTFSKGKVSIACRRKDILEVRDVLSKYGCHIQSQKGKGGMVYLVIDGI